MARRRGGGRRRTEARLQQPLSPPRQATRRIQRRTTHCHPARRAQPTYRWSRLTLAALRLGPSVRIVVSCVDQSVSATASPTDGDEPVPQLAGPGEGSSAESRVPPFARVAFTGVVASGPGVATWAWGDDRAWPRSGRCWRPPVRPPDRRRRVVSRLAAIRQVMADGAHAAQSWAQRPGVAT